MQVVYSLPPCAFLSLGNFHSILKKKVGQFNVFFFLLYCPLLTTNIVGSCSWLSAFQLPCFNKLVVPARHSCIRYSLNFARMIMAMISQQSSVTNQYTPHNLTEKILLVLFLQEHNAWQARMTKFVEGQRTKISLMHS